MSGQGRRRHPADTVGRWMEQQSRQHPDLDLSAAAVVDRIRRASRFLEHELTANLARHKLELWEFDMLTALLRAGPPYQLTAGEIGDSTMVTSGAVTSRTDRLVTRKYVTREIDSTNRRRVLITLTERARELLDVVMTDQFRFEDELLEGLDSHKRTRFAVLLRDLLIELGDSSQAELPHGR